MNHPEASVICDNTLNQDDVNADKSSKSLSIKYMPYDSKRHLFGNITDIMIVSRKLAKRINAIRTSPFYLNLGL